MKQIKQVLELNERRALSYRQIGNALGLPKSTVSDYLRRFRQSGLSLADLDGLTDRAIFALLFPENKAGQDPGRSKPLPDFTVIHQELRKKHVTRQLLWEEYRQRYPDGYGYTQFCVLYRRWTKRISPSMRQVHKAGEKMFIDYSGLTGEVIDKTTGAIEEADIFVAALGASGYTYAEASRDQTKPSFVNSHIHAFEYFGGVTEILVPDNLKSAVTLADRYDPDLNETFRDMADHYGAVVIPARPDKPKDKAKVELSVKLVQRWILARLRHRQFFSIAQLNQEIRVLLGEFNNKIIRYLGKSRKQLFHELDKPALSPLPQQRYVLKEFKYCRVNIDYHIQLKGSYYSVPYQLIGREVEGRYTSTCVDIYHENKRVAFHKRLYRKGSYSTHKEHMASSHRAYAEWTPSRMIQWAKTFGPNMQELTETILTQKPHPEMGFRTCLGILKAAKRFNDTEVVELTAQKMLRLRSYRVKHFTSILKNKTYLDQAKEQTLSLPVDHENLRGAAYYR